MPRARGSLERSFGRVIRDLRLKADLSQEELAHRAGLSPVYVSELERGLRSPSLATIGKLGKALGKPAGQLVKAAEEP